MPPRRSRSRERGPPSSLSPPEWSSNKLARDLSTRVSSSSSRHPTIGASIPLLRLGVRASNMNASYGGLTTTTTGLWSRSANTLRTHQEPLVEPASKGATSSTSMPTSPNYFDLLSEEEYHTETAPLPASDSQLAAKTVRFADPPHVSTAGKFPLTSTTTTGPPLKQTKQKKMQLHRTQPSTADLEQPQPARAVGHGVRTPLQPPLARGMQPKPL